MRKKKLKMLTMNSVFENFIREIFPDLNYEIMNMGTSPKITKFQKNEYKKRSSFVTMKMTT